MTRQPPIEEITRRIVEAMRPRRIVMFGSRARGKTHRDSDLDLMIEMETDLRPLERMRRVYRLFRLRDWAMDVVVYTPEEVEWLRGKRYSLVRTIEDEGKVLYERP